MNEHFRQFQSTARQQQQNVLPDSLNITQIAERHPDGNDFARLLLEGYAIYRHREFTRDKDPDLYPPLDTELGDGLPGELASGPVMLDIMLNAGTT
ncbi:hypothetical protein CCR95_21945 [Thiocystis minor]|uniref:hypothetical protein n=1 Tax=Thiocystis minor TaxID=61597 RepID=UPI0019136353|nr:hypothetical protein [Thiocystis minor]MBK5966664.1 hypothetical protein [Thiocystis minor]